LHEWLVKWNFVGPVSNRQTDVLVGLSPHQIGVEERGMIND